MDPRPRLKISGMTHYLGDDGFEHFNCLGTFYEFVKRNFISILPVTIEHCNRIVELPFHHRDPFDRIMIAQALVDKVVLLSADSRIKKYEIEVIGCN